jgi:CRP-like cAMP-binding protein
MTLSKILLSKEMALLDALMRTVHLTDSQVLFHKGERGDALYVIETGQVRIFTFDEKGQEITLNILGPGDTFGEMALVDEQPRAASAAAVGPTTLRRLSREDFLAKLHTSPGLVREIIELLSDRVRDLTDYLERMGQWARLVAQGRYSRVVRLIEESSNSADGSLVAVAAAMREMVKAIQTREESLRREAIQLRIQIDEAGRQQRVSEIVESEYFQSLAQQAQNLRRASSRS